MKVRVASRPAAGGLVVIGAFEGEKPAAAGLPDEVAGAARRLARRKAWTGRFGTRLTSPEGGGRVVALIGLGARAALDERLLGRWLESAVSTAEGEGFARLTLVLPEHETTAGEAAALRVLRELALSDYRFDRYRKSQPRRLDRLAVIPPADRASDYRRWRGEAALVADAVAAARDLSNTPPNEASPAWMAERAEELASASGLECEILGPPELEARGMGGLLAVGGGSARGPRLVRLAWGEGEEKVALVGKGVTFDTGGISIKPSAGMDEMKFDKSGACAVLGIAQGAAALQLPYRFSAYLPLAENMPDGAAYRPGDIVRCYGGRSVEVLNTDAEGRMILADALAWAAEGRPDVMVDFATLTGACVVALGHHGAGLFSTDDRLAGELEMAARGSGERLWRLPLWPEYAEQVKGRQADLRNSAGRWGGAALAAAFLQPFTGGTAAWAHLDIAGTAWVGADQKRTFGATGYGVALTLTWLMQRAGLL